MALYFLETTFLSGLHPDEKVFPLHFCAVPLPLIAKEKPFYKNEKVISRITLFCIARCCKEDAL